MRRSAARRRSISKRSSITLRSSDPRSGTGSRKARPLAPASRIFCSRRPKVCPKSHVTPAGCMATLAAVSDEWPAGIAEVVRKIRIEMLGMLRSRLEAGVAERRAADDDGHRGPQPILSQRLPGDGRPGAGRRGRGGTERPRRGGNGRLARQRAGIRGVIWRESAAYGLSIRRYVTGKSSESARHCPCGSRS